MTAPREILNFSLAGLGLLAGLPVLALAIIAVRRESPGPAIFKQTRVGRNGQPFTCYKVRTMYVDTPHLPTHEAPPTGVTGTGKWLRRLRIDEIPQLWNVLRNDMRLVGPRPCLPTQTELIAARRERGVDKLYPGITGISQTLHIDMSTPVKLANVDATYLGHVNARTDLKIMFNTVSSVLRWKDLVKTGA
jgi:O-antigen biosynthesis protein WbqP